jgi:Response regulator containing CheY-like receiver, AAA-type ATPase, and DNA-binding domains
VEYDPEVGRSLAANMKAIEKRILMQALTETRGNKALAARFLEISRRSLYYKLKEHGLERWNAPAGST